MLKVDVSNFFFHPLHESHSTPTKALAIITHVALTALTRGLYIFALALMYCMTQRSVTMEPPRSKPVHQSPEKNDFVGVQALKEKLSEQLQTLRNYANQGKWELIQGGASHFDWWMFPTDRKSSGQGTRYTVGPTEIDLLKNDPEFLSNYRQGVDLVAESWGWNVRAQKDASTAKKHWTNYTIRLAKMLHSLSLFGQDDLRQSMSKFIKQNKIDLRTEAWALQYLCN